MSVAEYESAAPRLFCKPQEEGQASQPMAPRIWKGFADIIEYHTETLAGRKTDIIPIERLNPKRRKDGKKKKDAKYEDYAVVLRRTWVQQKHTSVLVRIELEIQSEELCQAFRKIVINTYEGTDLESFPIKIKCPFSELFFYRQKIKDLADNDQTSETLRREAQVLYDFTTNNGLMSSILSDHDKYFKKGHVVNDILWTIYPPNSLVVVNVGMIQECWICRNVSTQETWRGFSWILDGFRIGFDGSSVGMVRQKFTIAMTQLGICKILDLPVIPFEQYKDLSALRKSLVTRADSLKAMIGSDFTSFSPKEYTGAAWREEFTEYQADFNPQPDAKQIDGRVVVDFKAYLDRHPRRPRNLESFKKNATKTIRKGKAKAKPRGHLNVDDIEPQRLPSYDPNYESGDEGVFFEEENHEDPLASREFDKLIQTEEIRESDLEGIPKLLKEVTESFHISKEDFMLLFPAMVPVFVLSEKKWWWLICDNLRDVDWNDASFQTLQLEENTKDLVQSLVRGHENKSITFDDVVPGKGQGLIFLLHGKPGLGKTLTAESVAEHLQRPLYSISGGELSTNVTTLEERLNDIFDLAKRWDAVSLLDEADVLLCKRNSAEMDRNAIVAVFLRKIEYFQGVLFLTTNRKQDFDEAFKSRIHVTISYPELSPAARSKIWKGLIEANKKVDTDASWTDEAFARLGEHDLNGRTIKNILRTATAYANAKKEALGTQHVDVIIRTELAIDN